MLVSRFALFTLLCVLFGNVVALRAAEPAVSEIAGLELWLDAQQEAAQRLSAPGSAFKSGEPISQWRDASGGKRMAVQTDAAGQPKLVQVGARADDAAAGAGWVVRFDGEDDHLRVLGMNRRYTSFTLFVVAAPHSNSGRFRGFLAFNQKNRKDYETGFNLDMNSRFSPKLQDLNLEGRGFGGARNLLKSTVPFGTLHVMEVVADATNKNVRLVFDGKPAGRREFSPSELIADDLTIGARHYENNAAPQRVQGFLHGDVAEVLLFDRVLTEGETRSVRAYLDRKYATLRKALPRGLKLASAAENIEPLVIVENPPSVQMLVPGFRVRELPVELTNINNLRYRPDGKLYALGYNGDVWLLNDVDGDGLEEAKTPFFENRGRLRGPIGMAVIPTGHALLQDADRKPRTGAQGVVVASKGKISALLDADGDDVAEEERVIATGWKEISQNVDAIGVAFDPKDGAIYFGLGTAAYNNAYLLDEAGRSAFDLGSERGTVQRIAPDLSGRTTVCTGVRFTIGMDFSDDNQLFVTDQEGATWLPNGNPFDELLHITPGRHYGFPPRHPKHLPRVFDEPSLFDYGPQHQSTCGMVFNRPFQSKGPIFGPAHWRGDVLVCGESRGKLYRTQLVRDADNEYVAHNHLIGCLGMLTVDCCISPRGDLVVACHSGGPDWGTGPTGIGKLFAIRYDDESPPQPTAVWAAGPQEVRVAFDRPLDPVRLKNLAPQTKIVYGEYVAAGDRFESIRPGYAVTQRQQSTPRHRLPVHGASITPDRRTLILSTAPHPAAVQYALTLPGLGREIKKPHAGELPQHAQVDLAYSLGGVRARWTPTDASQPEWSGWLPHLDLHVARALASDDAEQRRFWKVMEQPGRLTLETQIDPRGLFAPAVQPGSTLGYDAKTVETWVRQRGVLIQSDRSFILTTAGATTAQASVHKEGAHQVTLGVQQGQTRPLRFTLELKTGGATPVLRPSWSATLGDDRERSGSLALHRFLLPWAKTDSADLAVPAPQIVGALANASWGRGRRVFYSEEAGCSKCHVVHGKGGQVGPDLSNLTHRDYVSVLRDVTQPSFAINPDYITFIAATKDGRVLTGPIRSEGADVLIGDEDGKVTKLALVDIEE
ncbi:MAG: hypothetical protein CMJ48_14535, partial [Planctomycetaceae bacterium]|nr:hypothetical protein [Planctomycetaceae bacterium]